MLFKFSLLAFAALATSAIAAPTGNSNRGTITVKNNCDFSITVLETTFFNGQVLGESQTANIRYDTDLRTTFIAPGDVRNRLFSEKIPRVDFTYQLKGNSFDYAIKNDYGVAFEGHELILRNPNDKCPQVDWPMGVSTNSNTESCDAQYPLVLNVCGL